MDLKKKIEGLKEDVLRYSPNPEKVKTVAVTKYSNIETIENFIIANENNKNIFAENKVQIIREKIDYFKNKKNCNKKIDWHFIGNLQKNKVKYIINDVKLIHSVNKLSLAQEIDKRAKQAERVIEVLLEINISGEESKQGYKLEILEREILELLQLKNIKIIGLMTMAPLGSSEKIQREVFSKLRLLKDEYNKKYFVGRLTELSMGMSEDYKIALEEGATIIRIGAKLLKEE